MAASGIMWIWDTSNTTFPLFKLTSKTTDFALFHCNQVPAAMAVPAGPSLSDTSHLGVGKMLPCF